VTHESPTMRSGQLWVLWTIIVITQLIPHTWAKKKPPFDAAKAAKDFDKKAQSIKFKKPFAEMAQALMKNEKFQGKLKKFLGAISKPEQKLTFGDDREVIDAEIKRWGFNRRPNNALTPIQENEITKFIAMTMEPEFHKSVFKIAESVLNNKDFKDTMRKVLKEMSIKVEDKRGNSKSKPIKLTEDSDEY